MNSEKCNHGPIYQKLLKWIVGWLEECLIGASNSNDYEGEGHEDM